MGYHRILSVQDLSCLGQCSATVALPILSACGQEACLLPTALLSTHTGGFTDVHRRELTTDLEAICGHWLREELQFDAIYTGYLGSAAQIDLLMEYLPKLAGADCRILVDPAMADHGKLYKGFDEAYAAKMVHLCEKADVLLPNVTEACILTGMPIPDTCDEAQAEVLLERLSALGPRTVVLTGIDYGAGLTGAAILADGKFTHCPHEKLPGSCHGTGDIFTAAFAGSWMRLGELTRAVQLAGEFTMRCIRATREAPAHWYGVKFETQLPWLCRQLEI